MLPQMDRHVPTFIYPTSEYLPSRLVFPIKGSDSPNNPMQLSTRLINPPYDHLIPQKLCITKAYRSTANLYRSTATSNHSASSSHVYQWRPVSRWETNGTDLPPSLRDEMDERLRESSRQAYEIARILGCLDEAVLVMSPNPFKSTNEPQLTPIESIRPPTVCSSSTGMEHGQISPLKVSSPLIQSPIQSPESNVESSPPPDIPNPSWLSLSSSLMFPSPPPFFSRPSNISENPEWSPLWLTTPPLRKMSPLPTYQMPVTIQLSDSLIVAQTVDQPESIFVVNVAVLQPVNESEVEAIDTSLVAVLCREPSPN